MVNHGNSGGDDDDSFIGLHGSGQVAGKAGGNSDNAN